MTIFVSFQKYNRAHDRMGRFTTSGSGQAVSGKPVGRIGRTNIFGDNRILTDQEVNSIMDAEAMRFGASREATEYLATAMQVGTAVPHEENEPRNNWRTPTADAVEAYTGDQSRGINRDLSLGKHLIDHLGTQYGNSSISAVIGGTPHGSTVISAPIKVGTVAERQAFVDDVTARSKANGDSESRTRIETQRAEVFASRVNLLDDVIDNAPPINRGNPVTVYRGSNNGQGQLAALEDAMATGKTVTFRNFSSTSLDREVAMSATSRRVDQEPILLKISAVKGVVIGRFSSNRLEKEVLLPRNMEVRVKSITIKYIDGIPRNVVELEQINATFTPSQMAQMNVGKSLFVSFQKYNRNHDRLGRFSSGGGGGQVQQENAMAKPKKKPKEPTDAELEKEYGAMEALEAPKIPTAAEDYATLSEVIGWSGGKVTSSLVELTDAQLGAVLRAEDAQNNQSAFTAAGISDVAMGYIENKLYAGAQRDLHELAIEDYTSTAFAEINQNLSVGLMVQDMPRDVAKTVRQLDKAIRGAPPLAENGESVTLYRGIRGTRRQMEKLMKAMDKNETVTFKNFSSTSVLKEVGIVSSQQYAITRTGETGAAKPFVMEIVAKKGMVIGKHSSMHEEAEVLLARGTKVRIIGVRTEKTPMYAKKEIVIVTVEVVDR